MRTILWRNEDGGHERAVLMPDPKGLHLGGTALYRRRGQPIEVRYSVLTDPQWRTMVVGLHVQSGDVNRRLALRADGEGNWTAGADPQLNLAGALDVDLSFSPATNTLPIRRLQLAVGEAANVDVVYVDPHADGLRLASQRYERLDGERYRFSSGDFAADLAVDGDGLVTSYPGGWTAVAAS